MVHVIVPVFAIRTANHFGGPPVSWSTAVLPATAADGLAALDAAYRDWTDGLASVGAERLMAPVGPAEPFPDAPLAGLVLHIHREAIHHLAEILLLRDLYRLRRTS